MVYQIICGIGRIGETVFCTLFHDIFAEAHRRNHAGKQGNTAFYGVDRIKGQLFVFLHVFVVCQRDAFHRGQHGGQCSVNTAGLSSYQLCDIRVFLLRHDAAAGAVSVIDLHKAVFIGIPEDDLLAETAQMHHNR